MSLRKRLEHAVIWTLAASAGSGLAACGTGSVTPLPTSSVAATSFSPSAPPSASPTTPVASGPIGTLTLTGAINATVTGVAPVAGLVCEMGIGDVSGHLPSREVVMLAWGNITEATTDFPGSSTGAFVSFSRLSGGSWRANTDLTNASGTLTVSGSASSPQVSIDLSMASTNSSGSSLHVTGTFSC